MSKNNFLETSKELYYRFGEIEDSTLQQDEIRQFVQDNPIFNHEIIQYDENIKQLVFLRELIKQEGFLNVFKKMKRLKYSIIWLKQELKLYELSAYFDFFLETFDKVLEYQSFQKILMLLTYPTTNIEEFISSFLDTSALPIDELFGYNSYSNPIMRMIGQDDTFYLYDQMNQESFEVREGIKKACFNADQGKYDLELWKCFELIINHSDENITLFSKSFKVCIIQIFRKRNQKNRSRNLKPDSFTYYGSF